MRDRRFVARHRGGLLEPDDHRLLALWAADCAERVAAPCAACGPDDAPRRAIETARAWARGEASVGDARAASVRAHAAARAMTNPAAVAAARAAGHAAATAHMADHSLGAALYAQKALLAADASVEAERAWQIHRLPAPLRAWIDSALQEKQRGFRRMGPAAGEDLAKERKIMPCARPPWRQSGGRPSQAAGSRRRGRDDNPASGDGDWKSCRSARFCWVGLVAGVVIGVLSCVPAALAAAEKGKKAMEMTLTSTAFRHGAAIPARYTGDGADVSPPLAWTGVPEGTRAFALICDDPDAPMGTWVHWVLYDIPAAVTNLPEKVAATDTVPDIGTHGVTDFRRVGYGGPAPPRGKPHRYFFTLYALDQPTGLPARRGKMDVLRAIEGHILGKGQLIGTYQR
jgi:hypothetical protein